MKRIDIVVEGQTEQEFVSQIIQPYLTNKYGIYSVSAILIGSFKHRGGNVKFERLKKNITLLSHQTDLVISTFLDYFKLGNDFPHFEACQKKLNTDERIDCLERELTNAIDNRFFVPYIQKYEFEALLFASVDGYEKYITAKACQRLEAILQEFPNPEDINNTMPPSYRLLEPFGQYENSKYNKVTLGNILALETGIEKILERCPRFGAWIEKLAHMATQA
ncbi:DUF4276 family protein [Larkinella sp. VNQ87]|uniref:DUF4276 family protein n=1 Tax=Larkinella sp. VNQ87 TaxID=3400921 RepID=UPI003C0EB2DF